MTQQRLNHCFKAVNSIPLFGEIFVRDRNLFIFYLKNIVLFQVAYRINISLFFRLY